MTPMGLFPVQSQNSEHSRSDELGTGSERSTDGQRRSVYGRGPCLNVCACVFVAARLCGVASEAVACTYTAITLSLFHSLLLAGV